MRFSLIWAVCLLTAASIVVADKVTLEKPVPVTQKKADKTKINGRIIAYDEDGFDVRVKAEEVETVKWDELDTKTRYAVRKSVLSLKDAAGHVELGREMLDLEGGKELADKAFAVALKLDPSLKESVAEIKKDAAEHPPEKSVAKSGKSKGEDEKEMAGASPDEKGAAAGEGSNAPVSVGRVQQGFWGPQSEDAQTEAVKILKDFAEQTRKTMQMPLPLYETKYFLFYSDLPAPEAKKWAELLDVMYARLCELVGVKKGDNIWRGKALVFVFQKKFDYRSFQLKMHNTDPSWSAGMCHNYGNGLVHIAFYREEDEKRFAQVLVHESSHGFLHRYRSPIFIPSWINEGLAEWVADNLVYKGSQAKVVQSNARKALKQVGSLGEFFETRQIEPWQYAVAEMVTTFMIEKNRKGYVAFINAIKDGMEWEKALIEKFGMDRDQLLREFGAAMKV
jgi:hypothetical protein